MVRQAGQVQQPLVANCFLHFACSLSVKHMEKIACSKDPYLNIVMPQLLVPNTSFLRNPGWGFS